MLMSNFIVVFYFFGQISWNEILYSVNASVVGLARCASEEVRIGGPDPVFIFLKCRTNPFKIVMAILRIMQYGTTCILILIIVSLGCV